MGLFDQGLGNSKGLSPAAIALLGLLAVKGFENRDKLAGMLGGVLGGGNGANPPAGGSGTAPLALIASSSSAPIASNASVTSPASPLPETEARNFCGPCPSSR